MAAKLGRRAPSPLWIHVGSKQSEMAELNGVDKFQLSVRWPPGGM